MRGMIQAIANRFVSVAQIFLLSCLSVLLAAEAYSVFALSTVEHTQSHAQILFTLLH
jgi:hypothetical protein